MVRKNSLPQTSAARPTNHELMGRELSDAVIFFHEAVASHLGISAAEWKCLGLLDEHGPSTAGSLAELSGFTTGQLRESWIACSRPATSAESPIHAIGENTSRYATGATDVA